MADNIEVNEVLSRLKSELNIKKNNDLAEFLEVNPSTLSTWKKRNSIDYNRLINKCLNNGIELNKLFVHKQKKIGPTFELHDKQGRAEILIECMAEKAEYEKEPTQDLKEAIQDDVYRILITVF